MKWTDRQREAIDKRNCSLIVSAAAGSGKTAVLVERLTEILLDENNKTPADKLVVVTFTNDAAAEIKKRLRSALNKKSSENPDNEWLKQQQILLHKAKISTIHTFCYSIIRDNIDDEELTSAFRILDTTEAELLRTEAIDKVLNIWHKENAEGIGYLMNTICDGNDSNIEITIKDFDNFLSSTVFTDVWFEKAEKKLSVEYSESEYYKNNIKNLCDKASDISVMIESAMENSDGIYSDDFGIITNILLSDADIVRKLKKFILNGGGYFEPEFERFTSKKKNLSDPEEKDRIKNLRDNYKDKIKKLSNEARIFIDSGELEYEVTAKVLKLIRKLYSDFKNEEFKLKKEKNSLSFSDAEEMVLNILCDHDKDGRIYPKDILSKISSQYDLIMIDEFQDSNNKQDIIFKLLSKNNRIVRTSGDDIISYGENVFIVGDVKQSIYSFRQANPHNFTDVINSSSDSSDMNKDKVQRLYLNTNFRSSKGVVNFINDFFSEHMSEECGEVVYSENERLNYGAVTFDKATDLGVDIKTKFFVVGDDTDKNINTEEQFVAHKIYSMLASQAVVIDKDGKSRPCRPSDFCIIVRKNATVSGFRKELDKYGISVEGEKEEGYLQSEEVAVLINMLRIINNPTLDIACTSVLMSPMFMFSSDDMLEIKNISVGIGNIRLKNIITTLRMIIESKGVSGNLKVKITDFLEKFDLLRKFAVYNSLTSLVQKIYEVTGYSSVVGYNENGSKKMANLRLMFHYTNEYSEKNNSSASLSGFLMYIDKMNKNNANFSQATVDNSDAVQIKTCHGSKGLEYPFVFVVALHNGFSKQDSKKNLAVLPDGSVSFRIYDHKNFKSFSPVEFKRINERNFSKQVSEEMRLLYVALTRARQQLFITFDSKQISEKTKTEIKTNLEVFGAKKASVNVNSMAEWLYMYLIQHNSIGNTCQCSDSEFFDIQYIDSDFDFTVAEKEIENEKKQDSTELSDFKVNSIFEIVESEEKNSILEIEARKTVSEIIDEFKEKQEETDSDDIVPEIQEYRKKSKKWKRPSFIVKETTLKSSERGTAVHQFFQYVDFKKATEDIQSERKRLLEKGLMSEVYMNAVPDEYVESFLSSDLGKKVRKVSDEKVYREKQILLKMKDIYKTVPLKIFEKYKDSETMLKGIIDLYFFDENGDIILVDYKTDSLSSEQDFLLRYSYQINIYAAAIKCIEGISVKKMYLYSFNLKKQIEVPVIN